MTNIEYDTSDMEKCEYIEAMRKVYSAPPEQINGKCKGYKNRHNGNISKVCGKCMHFEKG